MTPDAAEISAMLADRIEPLCSELLPNGRPQSGSWRVGSLSGETGDLLSIALTGRPAGLWIDWATDEKGDALGLVKGVLGCDIAEALRWSRQWLGIGSPTEGRQRPSRRGQPFTSVIKASPERSVCDDEVKRDLASAERIVAGIVPLIGTPGQTYLRDVGKIDVGEIEDVLSRTDAIGWHPAVFSMSRSILCTGSGPAPSSASCRTQ